CRGEATLHRGIVVTDQRRLDQDQAESRQKAHLMKPLNSRGFGRACVNQTVLVRISTGDLGFGFELAHKPVNTPLPRVCFARLAFFARKLAFYASSATLLNGKEAIESSRIPRNGR